MKNRFLVMCALAIGSALSLSAQQNPPPDTSSSGQTTQQSTQPATSTDRYGNPVPATDNSQNQNPNNQDAQSNEQTPVYRVTVVQRTTEAVNYRDRSGSTEIDFKGTPLMPKADGHAKVTGHTGRLAVDATLHHIGPARGFGPEYLTYVLWAITTEGRAVNLGEVIPNGDGDVSLQRYSGRNSSHQRAVRAAAKRTVRRQPESGAVAGHRSRQEDPATNAGSAERHRNC